MSHHRMISLLCSLFIILLSLSSCSSKTTSVFDFKHHVIANPLPGTEWGYGGFTLADFDNDGDLDVTIQSRSAGNKVYWYGYQGADKWIQHNVGISGEGQLGAVAYDADRDGHIDLVMGHDWFRNPGNLKMSPDSEWEKYPYNGDMIRENHDIITTDINHDGTMDIVMYNQDAGTLRWYNIIDPHNWTYTDIATDINENDVHSGLFPGGAADLDSDSYTDLIMPLYWYKNPGITGEKWIKKEYPYTPILPNPYGKGMRVWSGDLNNDGLNDIVYSDCDVRYSKLYMLFNENRGESWKKEELPLPKSNVDSSGSLHSLQVADFDNDGDLDIFTGEQEDPDKLMKPQGLKERGIIFQNAGDITHPKFLPFIVHEDNPGWHDVQIGDVEGDGDIDIVSKVWNADEKIYHLDFWENKLK